MTRCQTWETDFRLSLHWTLPWLCFIFIAMTRPAVEERLSKTVFCLHCHDSFIRLAMTWCQTWETDFRLSLQGYYLVRHWTLPWHCCFYIAMTRPAVGDLLSKQYSAWHSHDSFICLAMTWCQKWETDFRLCLQGYYFVRHWTLPWHCCFYIAMTRPTIGELLSKQYSAWHCHDSFNCLAMTRCQTWETDFRLSIVMTAFCSLPWLDLM